MTIITTLIVPEGIIMCADSNSVMYDEDNGKKLHYLLSEFEEKICFSNTKNIGISFCGSLEWNGKRVSDIVKRVMNKTDVCNCIDAAKVLHGYLKKNKMNTEFCVSGYYQGVAHVYHIDNIGISQISPHIENEECYCMCWWGWVEYVRYLFGKNHQNIKYDPAHLSIKDAIDLSEFVVDLTCKCCRFNIGISPCGGPIDILLLTKNDSRWIKHKY